VLWDTIQELAGLCSCFCGPHQFNNLRLCALGTDLQQLVKLFFRPPCIEKFVRVVVVMPTKQDHHICDIPTSK